MTVMWGARYGADLLVAGLRPGEVGLRACGPLDHVGSNPTPGANNIVFTARAPTKTEDERSSTEQFIFGK